MEERKKVCLTAKAVNKINDILSKEKDVLLKYRKHKGEIEIVEQTVSVKGREKIRSE